MTDIKRSETAYHGRRDRKARFLKEQRAHQKADRFLQGSTGDFDKILDDEGWDSGEIDPKSFRGCGIACSVYSIRRIKRERVNPKSAYELLDFYNHEVVANYLGISKDLAYAFETVFEGLRWDEAPKWPVQFALALKPGTQPAFSQHEFERIGYSYDGAVAQRDYLLTLLRNAKPVVEAR